MSGGVDSTVAAMLALRSVADCEGAVMQLRADCGDGDDGVKDAKAAASRLGIPLSVYDFSDRFAELVIEAFIDAYRRGRTPNPCVDCNKHIKFGLLLEKALEMGRDKIITGHYARIARGGDGRFLLKKGADPDKDQSYVLYSLTQTQLARIVFPLGELSKKQVRGLALDAGFENAMSRESQDICFVPDGDYAKFIEGYIREKPQKGRFIGADGVDLGENKGIIHYTVGQRRGLGLAMPHPVYVLEIRPDDNTVVIGRDDQLYSKTLTASQINLIPVTRLDSPIRARVKLRYKQIEQPATIRQTGDDSLHIEFDEPQRAITKGQAAVIYDGENVIGGGTIV